MEEKKIEINAHVLIPQQVLQVLYNLMGPLHCCPTKRGITEAAIYVYKEKSYCHECLEKVANEEQVAQELAMGEAALHQ